MEISKIILKYRKINFLTQKKFGDILDYSNQYISAVENNKKKPSIKFLEIFMKKFNLDKNELHYVKKMVLNKEGNLKSNYLQIEQEILRLETKIKDLTKRNKKLIENERNYYKELQEFKKMDSNFLKRVEFKEGAIKINKLLNENMEDLLTSLSYMEGDETTINSLKIILNKLKECHDKVEKILKIKEESKKIMEVEYE